MATVSERLKKIIVDQLGVDESEVVPNASFVEDLNADSLDLVELIMSLEEEFKVQISDEDAEKITTVQEAEDYIEEHLRQFSIFMQFDVTFPHSRASQYIVAEKRKRVLLWISCLLAKK